MAKSTTVPKGPIKSEPAFKSQRGVPREPAFKPQPVIRSEPAFKAPKMSTSAKQNDI